MLASCADVGVGSEPDLVIVNGLDGRRCKLSGSASQLR
jgi:hypothetical protein